MAEKLRYKTKVINSRYLTPECWSIQFWGLSYCKTCDYLATENCGGMRIRRDILAGKYPKYGLPDLKQ